MVAASKNYYVKVKGEERGPFTLAQLSRMWVGGAITADAFYRLENIEEWAPLTVLAETLEAIAPARENQQAAPETGEPKAIVQEKNTERFREWVQPHGRIVAGNGSPHDPFVIDTFTTLFSARIQEEIIDYLYGAGTYRASGHRRYFPSPHGKPGNTDICEHLISINGQPASIWFDLYLISRLMADPDVLRKDTAVLESMTARMGQVTVAGKASTQLVESTPVPPHFLTGNECHERALIFRTKWLLIHAAFWIIVGVAGAGPKALLGALVSLIVLAVQVDWKKRELLRAMGLSQQEIERRLRSTR